MISGSQQKLKCECYVEGLSLNQCLKLGDNLGVDAGHATAFDTNVDM